MSSCGQQKDIPDVRLQDLPLFPGAWVFAYCRNRGSSEKGTGSAQTMRLKSEWAGLSR